MLIVSKQNGSPAEPAKWKFNRQAFWEDIESKMSLDRMTYREAADAIGITAPTLWRIQKRKPDVDTVARVCQWLGRPLDKFVTK